MGGFRRICWDILGHFGTFRDISVILRTFWMIARWYSIRILAYTSQINSNCIVTHLSQQVIVHSPVGGGRGLHRWISKDLLGFVGFSQDFGANQAPVMSDFCLKHVSSKAYVSHVFLVKHACNRPHTCLTHAPYRPMKGGVRALFQVDFEGCWLIVGIFGECWCRYGPNYVCLKHVLSKAQVSHMFQVKHACNRSHTCLTHVPYRPHTTPHMPFTDRSQTLFRSFNITQQQVQTQNQNQNQIQIQVQIQVQIQSHVQDPGWGGEQPPL